MVQNLEHTYEGYIKAGIIKPLSTIEKRKYEKYHLENYQEDQKVCLKLTNESPKWSIISGYYSMHNITKLFLAKFNIKIGHESAHTATLFALKKVIQDEKVKAKAIDLLKKAEQTYEILNSYLKEKILANMLSASMGKRSEAQYYSEEGKQIQLLNALSFQEDIIKPYIEIMEKLIKNAD